MPIAAIIALVEGVAAGIPSDIAAFNSLKALLAGGQTVISSAELEALRQEAAQAHQDTQNA